MIGRICESWRLVTCLGLLLVGLDVFAARTVFDFEETERGWSEESLPHHVRAVTNAFATSGRNSYHVWYRPYDADSNVNRWTGIDLRVPADRMDWRGYDRLAFDVVSLEDCGDQFGLRIFSTNHDAKASVKAHRLEAAWTGRGRGLYRLEMPLRWSPTVRADCVARLHLYFRQPLNVDFHLDNFRLLKPGEDLGLMTGEGVPGQILPMISEQNAARAAMIEGTSRRIRQLESRMKFLSEALAAGTVTAEMAVGTASAMARVMPRDAFSVAPASGRRVRLARGETESFQVLVTPLKGSLRRVSVVPTGDFVSDDGGSFAASNVTVAVLGYSQVRGLPGYRIHPGVRPALGWYPDPILDFMRETDVVGEDVQGFWVRVKAPFGQRKGLYRGRLAVSANGGASRHEIPLEICVNGFDLPRVSPLRLQISFQPRLGELQIKNGWDRRTSWRKTWMRHYDEWTDFLADRWISMDMFYYNDQVDVSDYVPAWRRLQRQGRLGFHCIGHWAGASVKKAYPGLSKEEADVRAFELWKRTELPRLDRDYQLAKAAGMLENAYFYGADEVPHQYLDRVVRVADEVRRRYPGVMLTTTGLGHDCTNSALIGKIDMFCPTTSGWHKEPRLFEAARKQGSRVAWYICNNPDYPHAQMFVECDPIESRLLQGALAVKYRPDAFLIWSITSWKYEHEIRKGPFTDWNPNSWGTDNGSGSWVYMGPDHTPVATVRLENFKDGLEDYAYAWLYHERFGRWPTVPQELVRGLTDFSRDPDLYEAWRDSLANQLDRR